MMEKIKNIYGAHPIPWTLGLLALAAKGENGRGVLMANIGEDTQVQTNLPSTMTAYLVDENNYLVQTKLDPKCFLLKENQVVYLEETV